MDRFASGARKRFFFSSRRRHTRLQGDWSSDVCSSDLAERPERLLRAVAQEDGPEDQPQRQHSEIEHCTPPQNVSKSRYLTSNKSGNNVPCVGVPRVS